MSYNQKGGRVDQTTYMKACDLLYNDHGQEPKLKGKQRQEVQKIKHANDKKQKGPNHYAGPKDKSKQAQSYMKKIG